MSIFDTTQERTKFGAWLTSNRETADITSHLKEWRGWLGKAQQIAESAPIDPSPEFTIEDSDLNALLNAVAGWKTLPQNMDTGLHLVALIEKVAARLATSSPTMQEAKTDCGACGAKVGERCRTSSDNQCDAGKHVVGQEAEQGVTHMELQERDPSKTNREQGFYRKFDIRRTDGSSEPGGKHYGCVYFVLDATHDPYAMPAMRAYADACEATHPHLAKDLIEDFGLEDEYGIEEALRNRIKALNREVESREIQKVEDKLAANAMILRLRVELVAASKKLSSSEDCSDLPAKLMAAAVYRPERDQTELFRHWKKGGIYQRVGQAIGAGLSKDKENVIVYQSIESGRMFFRSGPDFEEAMRPLGTTEDGQ